MFNSYYGGSNRQSVHINSVTGAILKNHPQSWFERFHLKSDRAKALLTEGGDKGHVLEYNDFLCRSEMKDNPDNAIVVLQMVICGDMEVLAECVYKKDYLAQTATAQ